MDNRDILIEQNVCVFLSAPSFPHDVYNLYWCNLFGYSVSKLSINISQIDHLWWRMWMKIVYS